MIRVYLGFDKREEEAYRVAEKSILSRASVPVCITPLYLDRFRQQGLMRRPLEVGEYQTTDVISGAKQSTEFATTRFLVPFLAHTGMAIFMDCDVVCLADIKELSDLYDPRYAVQVVKHNYMNGPLLKMDGQEQQHYWRKNWSSVAIYNCDAPGHRRMTIDGVNGWKGLDLHQFLWLKDEEIGELPREWNVLVGVQEMPADPKILHYTLGTPDLLGHANDPHADIWLQERDR